MLGCLVQREIHRARRKTLLAGEQFLFVIHNILLLAANLELERILVSAVYLFKPILAVLLLSKQYQGEEFTGARCPEFSKCSTPALAQGSTQLGRIPLLSLFKRTVYCVGTRTQQFTFLCNCHHSHSLTDIIIP